MKKYYLTFIVYTLIISAMYGQRNRHVADGDAAYINGKYKAAVEFYNKSIALNDTSSLSYYLRGVSKFYTKDYTGANTDLSIALSLSPTNKNQRWETGPRTKKLGDDFYTITMAGISFVHSYSHIYYFRGQIKYQLKDYRGGIKDFDNFIVIDTTKWATYFFRGICKHNLSQFNSAKLDYSKSIKLNSTNEESYRYRGLCNISLGLIDKGCQDLSRAGELGDTMAYKLIEENCNNN